MGSEDFAFMLQARPGCYIWVGNGDRPGSCMIHNPGYDFNDEILPLGASYWATLAEQVLSKDATVRKAADAVAQDELYIVPVDFKGRSCYRMGWGLYQEETRAASALRSLPDYFRQPGIVPRVVPTATFLR